MSHATRRKIARWLVGAALAIIGTRAVPEPSSSIEQWWGSEIPWAWIEGNWAALACFVLATLLWSYDPFKWWIDRQHTKDVRLRIRAGLTPGTFHETDAAAALRYLLRESVWGWKMYARLNLWTFVDGLHLAEMERAARDGDIITTAWDGQAGKTVVIDGRIWVKGRIEENTATRPHQVVLSAGPAYSRLTFSQVRVATADMYTVWPQASLARRSWSRTWVWLKMRWYWLTGVPNVVRRRWQWQ